MRTETKIGFISAALGLVGSTPGVQHRYSAKPMSHPHQMTYDLPSSQRKRRFRSSPTPGAWKGDGVPPVTFQRTGVSVPSGRMPLCMKWRGRKKRDDCGERQGISTKAMKRLCRTKRLAKP